MKLSAYLKLNNLSYGQFAESLGLQGEFAKVSVWRYVRGTRKPKPAIAEKIVRLTNGKVSFEDLYL